MSAAIRAFWQDESGATAIEYGLMAALVAVAIIGSYTALGDSLEALFNTPSQGVIANQTAILNAN